MELTLNTYSECVAAFREADQLMGSAFRQLVQSIETARDFYIEQNSDSDSPASGFQTQFAADCGVDQSFVSRIDRISRDPEIRTAVLKFPDLSHRAALQLLRTDPESRAAALEQLETTGELTAPDIRRLSEQIAGALNTELSEFETAQIERDTELEREKTRKQILEYIQPSDSDISRITHFLFSAGIQLDTYQSKTGEQLTAQKIADFIVAEATADSDRYSGDPEIFAESIRDLRQIVDLFGRALELVSDQRPPKLTLIK